MTPDSSNPYTPPEAILLEAHLEEGMTQPYAGKGLRFANFVIDQGVIFGLSTGLFTLLFWFSPEMDETLSSKVPTFLLNYGFVVLYHFLNELCGGRGISKLITGTRAEMKSGARLGARSALTRSLCRIIPFEPFSFLGSRQGGWHDSITDTRVINIRALPVQKRSGWPGPGAFTPPGVRLPNAAGTDPAASPPPQP